MLNIGSENREMSKLLRDSILGQIWRLRFRPSFLLYADELELPLLPSPVSLESFSVQSDVLPDASPPLHPSEKDKDIITVTETAVTSSAPSIISEHGGANDRVDGFSADDPDCPYNWSSAKKAFVTFQICAYTFAVYIASAICLASLPVIIQEYNVSLTASSLIISFYILGCTSQYHHG